MQQTLSWAALPPTAKLCLTIGMHHGGLVKTDHGYIGRLGAPDTAIRFGAIAVVQLMREGLAETCPWNEQHVMLTFAAQQLLHTGSAPVERPA